MTDRELLYSAAIRGNRQESEPVVRQRCNMGVGCEQYGICYAASQGEPDRCGMTPAPDDLL